MRRSELRRIIREEIYNSRRQPRTTISLSSIANNLLREADDTTMPTWGEVLTSLQAVKAAQTSQAGVEALKATGKVGLALVPGMAWLKAAMAGVEAVTSYYDVAKTLVSLGKSISFAELKAPSGSEFKKLAEPFWRAIRIDPEVSEMLDDELEAEFINNVLIPLLKRPGSENERIPNMNLVLGRWLNDEKGVKNADILFKAKQGTL